MQNNKKLSTYTKFITPYLSELKIREQQYKEAKVNKTG